MMNEKERSRVRKYKSSYGLARVWYYIVIALTMGNVDEAVAQYDREESVLREKELDTFTRTEQKSEAGCSYVPYGSYPTHNRKPEPVLTVDEKEEEEDIDLLTAAILAQHIAENQNTAQYDTTPEPTSDSWGGFGGGGDFGGGGAGGSWEESPTATADMGGSVDLGSDSY